MGHGVMQLWGVILLVLNVADVVFYSVEDFLSLAQGSGNV